MNNTFFAAPDPASAHPAQVSIDYASTAIADLESPSRTSNYSDFLNAVFAATQAPIPVFLDGQEHAISDPAFFREHEGELRVSPLTEDGVAFFFGVLEDAAEDSYTECRVRPTAALFKDGVMILVWALDCPATAVEARPIADALGMDALDECIPLPGTDGWALVYVDADIYCTLKDLAGAYGSQVAPTHTKVLGKYGDANILTPFDPADERYAQEMIITVGGGAESQNWKPVPMTIATLFLGLSEHKEGKKDGTALVLGKLVPGRRLKNAVVSLFGVGLDIDTGMSSEAIDKVLIELGCAAVRYTTHSHFKERTDFKKDVIIRFAPNEELNDDVIRRYLREEKHWDEAIIATASYAGTDHTEKGIMATVKHASMPKNRVIIPFIEPFVIADEGVTQQAAMDRWTKVPLALAEKLNIPLDKTGTDPSRLFYFPRHAKNRPYEIAIFGGDLFDWHTLVLDDPLDRLAAEVNKGTSKSKTQGGRDLGRWSMKAGHGFQIADVLEEHCPDRIRGKAATVGVEIECPFDENHNNAGDPNDRACFAVNAGDGSHDWFTISCQHESCRDKTMLDMLGKMVTDGWFDRSVLDDEKYNAVAPEDAPQPEVAKRIQKEDKAKKDYKDAVNALSPDSAPEDVQKTITMCLDANLDSLSLIFIHGDIAKKLKTTTTTIRKLFKVAQSEETKKAQPSRDSTSEKIADALSKSLGRRFTFPPPHLGVFNLAVVDEKIWLQKRSQDGGPDDRLCTPFVLTGGVVFADRDHARALRIEVLNQDNKWVVVEIAAADLATLTGVDALRALMGAGLACTRRGKEFVTDFLTESQPRGPTVYDRPGFRDDGFICPTGQVLLTNKQIELASKSKLKCSATSGSFDAWREGVKGIFGLPIDKAHHLQAGVLIGLAGPVVNMANDESIAYGLEGESSTGKSSAQAAAVCNWCNPDLKGGNGLFVAAKGTDNSHEAILEKGTGTVIGLDEFGQLPAKAQQEIMFMLQAGAGKRRLNAKAEERPTRGWKGGALIVSAETGFAQRLHLEGVRQAGGLAARMLPISTDQAGKLDAAQYACVAKAIQNFGWSGPEFVLALRDLELVKHRAHLKEMIGRLVDQLANTGGPEGAYRRRAARHVAYLWAAGLIAQGAGLVPEDFNMKALAVKLWEDALRSDSGPTDQRERALKHLVDAITARKGVDIVDVNVIGDDKRFHREAVGYFDELKGHYIIRETKFDELSGGFLTGRAFRSYLDDIKYLVKQSEKSDSRTWNGYPGLGKDAQYVVLHMDKISD